MSVVDDAIDRAAAFDAPFDEAPTIATSNRGKPANWQRSFARIVGAGDLVAVTAGVLIGQLLRFGPSTAQVRGVPYRLVSLVLIGAWVAFLRLSRTYEPRFLGAGAEEYKLVLNASARFTMAVVFVSYIAKISLSRGYVGLALPLGTVFLLLSRYWTRRWLNWQRVRRGWVHRVVVMGSAATVTELAQQIRRDPGTGFEIVGACLPSTGAEATVDEGRVPVLGPLSAVAEAIDASGADTVMVTSGPGVTGAALRRLGWALEGRGVDLVVAPALTEVSGPRISMRPVAGLPMLHLDEPDIEGHRHLLKQLIERTSAAALLVLLLPALAIVALAVRLTSRGPALFRQIRVGVRGQEFTLYKFRSMHEDAEEWLPALAEHNEFDGPMFKICRDPRVTPVGRFIRRWSLDELPQLWNVVRGDMALIGPRPPLPHEVSQYADDVRRRLLVRPGLTGLWQVSGRSNLSWEETVRLDLSYVENWSLALDLQILWRTIWAVLQGRGAY